MDLQSIPESLRGKWAVISAVSPTGEKWGGEILEEWELSARDIRSESGRLKVQAVSRDTTATPEIVLVNFTNGLQYAFMLSTKNPDLILVSALGNGEEQMRYLITQEVYR